MRTTTRLIGIALMARSIGLPVMATAGGFVIRDPIIPVGVYRAPEDILVSAAFRIYTKLLSTAE